MNNTNNEIGALGWADEDEDYSSLEPAEAIDPAEKYAKSQLRVVRETKDYQLDYLKYALHPDHDLINALPLYQRRLRWSNGKRSLLIESFLLNIPVPPVYLFESDYNKYEVIDGRQRLETIRDFLSNGFELTGLEYWSELNKKRFNELPHVLQRGLLRRSLQAVVLLAETQNGTIDFDIRRVLFDRLNTGGIKLNPQELRNALFPGELNALLIRLARSCPFTDIWRIPRKCSDEAKEVPQELLDNPLYSSLADAELVLRFFAIRDAVTTGRSGSLRRILDRYMEENHAASHELLSNNEAIFTKSINFIYSIFGDEAFRLPITNKASRPLYDALMVGVSTISDDQLCTDYSLIRSRLSILLVSESTFEILVGRGNTFEAIKARVELAKGVFLA